MNFFISRVSPARFLFIGRFLGACRAGGTGRLFPEYSVLPTSSGPCQPEREAASNRSERVPLAQVLACWLTLLFTASLARAADTFVITGNMASAAGSHTATLLIEGKVLIVGGRVVSPTGVGSYPRSAQLYNPATGTWSATGMLPEGREGHTATLLPNGRVIIVGGVNSVGYLASAQLYNPATGTWSTTGSLGSTRSLHAAVLLPDGKVLVVGGENNLSVPVATAQIYDPATGSWTATGSLSHARRGHTATLLANGKVLVAGGASGTNSALTELYDPATALWSISGALVTSRAQHTATRLPGGKVLIAGGGFGPTTTASNCELYDEATGAWSATSSLSGGRLYHSATLLENGKVMVTGGTARNGSDTGTAALYDPAAGAWSLTGSLSNARNSHSTTLLADGKVLAAGGFTRAPDNPGLLTALIISELYEPATVGTINNPLAANITRTSASLGGDVTKDGGQPVTSRGVVFAVTSANGNPEIGGTGVTSVEGTGTTGVFSLNVSGLQPATDYSFKAYAVNSLGTGYSAVGAFKTLTMIEQWRLTWYGSAANSGKGADTASPFGTGIPNLAVYAFLGPERNPALAQPGELPQAVFGGGLISVSFTPPADLGGITYSAEFSPTLSPESWTPLTDTGTAPVRQFSIPVTPNTQGFLRLRVARF